MRLRSNGIGAFIIRAIAGSFITFAFTLSRCVLDLKTIHEKTGTSPTLHLAALVNERPIVVLRSSPAHSRYSRAPFFCQTADRKSTRLNSSHPSISYAVFCLKKKKHKLSVSHMTDFSYNIILMSI